MTSDHGEEFQEHGLVGHGDSLYWPSLHVPLIIAYEGCVPATTVSRTVSLRDVPRTILDLTGIDSPEIPGSFAHAAVGRDAVPGPVVAGACRK